MLVTLTATLDHTYTIEYGENFHVVESFDDWRRIKQILTRRCVSMQDGYEYLVWIWYFTLPTTH